MWVEFVVSSLLCSDRFFSGYSSFPLSSKTNLSKFQFDLVYCQALYHEPLARVIAQALSVFDITCVPAGNIVHQNKYPVQDDGYKHPYSISLRESAIEKQTNKQTNKTEQQKKENIGAASAN